MLIGPMATIHLRGAREHNLRGVDLDLPREALIVFTGVSGSGKSSLAFDTLFAESQRRFVEALAPTARGRFGAMHKPAFEQLTGLAPAIGLSQRGLATPSPRSTVGTLTEVLDLLRVWWAQQGVMHCPRCHRAVHIAPFDAIVRTLTALPEGQRLVIAAPVARGRIGALGPLVAEIVRQGFTRVRVDGQPYALDAPIPVDPVAPHDVDVVVDRIKTGPDRTDRLQDAVNTALKAGQGAVVVVVEEVTHTWTVRPRCVYCDLALPDLTPRLFSFNAAVGACARCEGLGVVHTVDADAAIRDADATIEDGALEGGKRVIDAAAALGVDLATPWKQLPWEARDQLLNGAGDWEGVLPGILRKATGARASDKMTRVVREAVCPDCGGGRLGPVARGVTVDGASLPDALARDLGGLRAWAAETAPAPAVRSVRDEILRRLDFLLESGLAHLSLDRSAGSLSAGELQRVRLASQAGNQLSGVLYVLDEPTAGLHPADTAALVGLLRALRDAGNTVLVVEHDPDVIAAADLVVDFGPGAGREGGSVVYQGSPAGLALADTPTGRWLSGAAHVPPPRPVGETRLRLLGARGHTLAGDPFEVPLNAIVGVTGVSGAGKSSLILDTLAPAIRARLDGGGPPGLPFERLDGIEGIRRLVTGDGTGFGRSSRANVATATRIWDALRELYARTPEAKLRGFGPERFSFNTPGGRCERCAGEGVRHIDLQLLPTVTLPCDVCDGKRYDEATLAVTWRGLSIADLLALPVREARPVFANQHALALALGTLDELGLGYLPLGQPADTWSGGEAQRVRLARELGRPGDIAGTLFLLDEPSVGLHPQDVAALLAAFRRLVAAGASILVVEHDPVLLRGCDWLVELGPGAGRAGGRVTASGTVADVKRGGIATTAAWL